MKEERKEVEKEREMEMRNGNDKVRGELYG